MNRYQRITSHTGILFDIDTHEVIDRCLMNGGWEAPVTDAVLRYLQPGSIALDIGANVGAHALPMAQKVGRDGRVFAFEPMTYAFTKLKQNCSLNPTLRVTKVCMALGAEQKQFEAFYKSSWPWEGRERQDFPCIVDMTTLDDFWRWELKIDVIKLDVDGNEFDVLWGAMNTLTRCKPTIVAEVVSNHFAVHARDPWLFLEDCGYSFADLSGATMTYEEIKKPLPEHDPDMTRSINIVAVPK